MNRVVVCAADAQMFLFLRHILAMAGFEAVLANQAQDLSKSAGDEIVAVMVEHGAADADFRSVLSSMRDVASGPGVVLMARDVSPSEAATVIPHDFLMGRPLDLARLLAFLAACRRKFGDRATAASGIAKFADLEMNLRAMTVTRAGRNVHLSALQFRLLRRLIEEPTVVRDREDLIATCWPLNVEVEPRTVDIHIGHLRRALLTEGADLLRTVRGHGYALQDPCEGGI